MPSGEPTLLSRSLKTSGVIVAVSPDLLLFMFIYPFLRESLTAEEVIPVSVWIEKFSLETNFISPLILADDLFVLLTSINNFGFFCEVWFVKSSPKISKLKSDGAVMFLKFIL